MSMVGTAVQQLSHFVVALLQHGLGKQYSFYGVDEFAHLCKLTPEATDEH